jgi:hypothetical protein
VKQYGDWFKSKSKPGTSRTPKLRRRPIMRNLTPVIAAAMLFTASAVRIAVAADCADLLGPMAGIMQSMRMGGALSPVEQHTWRAWNTRCKDRAWQDQLAQTLPGGPPAPMVIDTPIYVPPDDPAPSLRRRDDARTALTGINQGIRLPITTCRTTYAARKGRAAYYTTCNTIGGYYRCSGLLLES